MPANDRVRLELHKAVATVTLNRPEQHNGMDFRMLEEVLAIQRQLRKTRDLRAVLITGAGPSFCAGLDFKTVLGQPLKAATGYAQLWAPWRNDFQRWSLGWRELPVPVIAAIHGNCFGAGLQLALGADFRIATPDARLSVMESKWGLIPDMGGTVLLRELLPLDAAKELTMTGRVLEGAQAQALGLVTQLNEQPLDRARQLAAEIQTRSPDAVAAAKFLLQQAWSSSEHGALAAERRWQRRLMGSRNQRIAVQRNLKKQDLPFEPRRIRP